MHLDCILAAGTGSSLDQGVACVNDSTNSVCIGVQLGLKRLMFLMLTLMVDTDGERTTKLELHHPY